LPKLAAEEVEQAVGQAALRVQELPAQDQLADRLAEEALPPE
jgi:hypothetical protein